MRAFCTEIIEAFVASLTTRLRPRAPQNLRGPVGKPGYESELGVVENAFEGCKYHV